MCYRGGQDRGINSARNRGECRKVAMFFALKKAREHGRTLMKGKSEIEGEKRRAFKDNRAVPAESDPKKA